LIPAEKAVFARIEQEAPWLVLDVTARVKDPVEVCPGRSEGHEAVISRINGAARALP